MPTFGPVPPLGTVTGPITGEPVMPSPTTGSSSVKMNRASSASRQDGLGPPSGRRRRLALRLDREQALLPSSSWPVCASSASSEPCSRLPRSARRRRRPSAYSSLVPTTISGLPSPVRSPTAGVSTIAPWLRSPPAAAKVGACVCGSIDVTLERSTTSTGKPSTAVPSSSHA